MMKEVLASQAKAEEKLAESAVHNASEEEPKVPEDSNQNVVSVSPKFRQDFAVLDIRGDISHKMQMYYNDDSTCLEATSLI